MLIINIITIVIVTTIIIITTIITVIVITDPNITIIITCDAPEQLPTDFALVAQLLIEQVGPLVAVR